MNHDAETTVYDGYGGNGIAIDITGSSVIYAGGGNGSDFNGSVSQVYDPSKTTIQLRGGGGYGSDTGNAQNGLDGTGGGGGGQGNDSSFSSGNGGSGIVIIRYSMGTTTTTTTQTIPSGYLKFQSEGNTNGYWKVESEPPTYTDGIFNYPEIFLPKLYRFMFESRKSVVNYQYSFNNTGYWTHLLPNATIYIESNTIVKLRIFTTTVDIINELDSDTFNFALSVAQSGAFLESNTELIYNGKQTIHTVDFTTSPYDTTSYDTNITVFLRFKTANYVYDQQDFTILRADTSSGLIGGSVGTS